MSTGYLVLMIILLVGGFMNVVGLDVGGNKNNVTRKYGPKKRK
jgi:hypothetical protein